MLGVNGKSQKSLYMPVAAISRQFPTIAYAIHLILAAPS
jgi:hypothetical protein